MIQRIKCHARRWCPFVLGSMSHGLGLGVWLETLCSTWAAAVAHPEAFRRPFVDVWLLAVTIGLPVCFYRVAADAVGYLAEQLPKSGERS